MRTNNATDEQANIDLETISKAVGLVVIQWGQAEQTLDMLVAMLYQSYGGKLLAKRIPRMLDPKLEFLSKCLAKIPALAQFQTEGTRLIAEFDRLSKTRHEFVHGAVVRLSPVNGAFVFAKLDVRDDFHVVREVRFNVQEFPALMKDLVRLGGDTVSLVELVLEHHKQGLQT